MASVTHTILRATVFPEPGFPLGFGRRHVTRSVRPAKQHGHDFSELVVVTGGEGIHCTGNRRYTISAGDVFVINGKRSHGYEEGKDLQYVDILFDLERLHIPLLDLRNVPGFHALFTFEPILRNRGRFQSRLQLSPTELDDVCGMIDRLESEIDEQGPGWRFAACVTFMRMLSYLCRRYSEIPRKEPHQPMRLGAVVSFLQEHYAEPITLEDLTDMASMSRSTMLRAFKLAFGRSPIEYLIRLRVDRAAALLKVGDMPISEISLAVGFQDSNYFSRQFRKVTGLSPRAYRKKALRK